eukprot:3044905-Amphidinium_carterae.1
MVTVAAGPCTPMLTVLCLWICTNFVDNDSSWLVLFFAELGRMLELNLLAQELAEAADNSERSCAHMRAAAWKQWVTEATKGGGCIAHAWLRGPLASLPTLVSVVGLAELQHHDAQWRDGKYMRQQPLWRWLAISSHQYWLR